MTRLGIRVRRTVQEQFAVEVVPEILVDIAGLSYAETAALLDVPVGTVMSRLHRARTRMCEHLAAADLTERSP